MADKANNTVEVVSVETPTKRRFTAPFRLFKKLPKWARVVILIVLVGLIALGIFFIFVFEPKQPVDEQAALNEASQQSLAAAQERMKLNAEAPSPEQQYANLQTQAADLKDPNDPAALETFVNAAFAGARQNSPEARAYAAKALELYPTDPSARAMFAGQIARLEAIERGDYAAALQ